MKSDITTIIKNATLLFSQHGTQSVSMDDIAGYCGISKKTIYVFFDSKEMLIIEIVKAILAQTSECLSTMSVASLDVLSEMNNLLEQLQKIVTILTPPFIREVKKYYPAAYDLFVEFREKSVLPFVVQNIKKGVEQNVYRPDVDYKIVSLLYCWQLQNVYESASVPLQPDNLLGHVNNLLFRSIIHTPNF
jgi:AcrR family transcriptional regulator